MATPGAFVFGWCATAVWFGIAAAATVNVPLNANIQAAVDANPPGTTFLRAPGVYTMQSVAAQAGDQFVGTLDPSGNRLTVLSGSQVLTSFTQDIYGNWIATTDQTQPGQLNGFCDAAYPRCIYPEDLIYDDIPYVQAASIGQPLAPGTFYFDYPDGLIYFSPLNSGENPNQHVVEYSRVRSAISGDVPNVVVQNLIVEKYAVPAQFGAIGDQYPGPGWIVQNNEVWLNHGAGIHVVDNSQVLSNYTHDNGQEGMDGSGTGILVQGNEIARNNYAGFDHNFECGGFKFAYSVGLIVSNNYSHDNNGPGMWTDISSIQTLYENNYVANNARSGIFHETSYDATIRNNLIFNNGSFAPDDWFWNAAIQIAGSRNVEAYGNIVLVNSENNGNGIMLFQQDRSDAPCLYGPCITINNYIHDNVVIVTGARPHGSSGGVQDYSGLSDMYAPSSNNLFAGDQYYVTDVTSAAYWQWNQVYQTFASFQSFGFDVTGSVNPN